MTMKTYFVYDKATGYILSGFDVCSDDHSDGYNIFTRHYKHPEPLDLLDKNEKCRLDFIYYSSKNDGLKNLKYEGLVIAETDSSFKINRHFVENPNYWITKGAPRGWWKIDNI